VRIQKFYQRQNLGFDGNVLELYKECRSDYIWFFSDDDLILDDALRLIIDEVDQESPDVLMFSFEQPPGSRIRAFDYEDRVYRSMHPVEQIEMVFRYPKITAYVLRAVKFDKKNMDQLAPFLGTNLYFIALCYSVLQVSPRSMVAVISEFLAQSDDDYNVMRFGPETWLGLATVLSHSFVTINAPAFALQKERELYYVMIQALWAANVGFWITEDNLGYRNAAFQVNIKPRWLLRNPKKALQLVLLLVGSKWLFALATKVRRRK
jgi:glycosyltransferase involved in cell wall biosynthesis